MSKLQDYLYKKILTFHKTVIKKNEKSIKHFSKYILYALLIECGIALLELWWCMMMYGAGWSGNHTHAYFGFISFWLTPSIFPILIFLFSSTKKWKRLAISLFFFNLFLSIFLYVFDLL